MIRTLGLSLLLGTTAVAQDDVKVVPDGRWEVCNQTSFVLRIATARIEAGELAIEGWSEADAGACLSYGVETDAERFVLAESHPLHAGGIREWAGDVELCADADDFSAIATQSCALQNLGTRNFKRVAGDERRTLLVEPEDYGDKAAIAGLQRLLRDAGYKVRRVDGLTGRATTKLVRQFLKDNALAANLEGEALTAALRDAADIRQQALGVTLCNESTENIWGAIALFEDERWTSRGWWPVAPDACVQVANRSVKGLQPHIFALQEDTTQPERDPDDPEPTADEIVVNPDRRLRAVATKPSQFCISEGRFAALGRDQCRDRGYVPANFRELSNDQDGVKLSLSDSDFVAPSGSPLRR